MYWRSTIIIENSKIVPLVVSIRGQGISFDINVKPAECAWFALGVRKSGSSVFSNIVNALAMFNNLNIVDIPDRMFRQGFRYPEWIEGDRIKDLLWRGNAYIGFRDPPTTFFDDPVFRDSPKILMVRDPRDALVSEYYSNAYSHSLPGGPGGKSVVERERERALVASVEEYVINRVGALNRTVSGYRRLLEDPRLLILKYEDVVFDKAAWIAKIAKHFGWRTDHQLIKDIVGWADVHPAVEDPTAFVRRVTPGDHLDKLSPSVISAINQELSDVWDRLGYAIGERH